MLLRSRAIPRRITEGRACCFDIGTYLSSLYLQGHLQAIVASPRDASSLLPTIHLPNPLLILARWQVLPVGRHGVSAAGD